MNIRHVRQEDPYGCGLACLAMLTEQTYRQVQAAFAGHDRGIIDWAVQAYLADNGYAVAWKYPNRIYNNQMRADWPPALWADVHIAQVQMPAGSHFIVVLRDGSVLDPATDAPRRWSDYGAVNSIGAVYRIAADPGPLADGDRPATPTARDE